MPTFFKNGCIIRYIFVPRDFHCFAFAPMFAPCRLKPNSSIYHIVAQYGPHQPMAGSRNAHFGLGHEYDSCAGLRGCHSEESMFDYVIQI